MSSHADSAHALAHVRALLTVADIVHHERDSLAMLQGVACAISEAFGYGIVVLSLFRPATQDMQSLVIHGGGPDARAKQGNVTPLDAWAPLLDDRFTVHGCRFIPAGAIDWEAWGGEVVRPVTAPSTDADAWDPDDALLAPLTGRDGRLIGVIAVDDPASGRRPLDADLHVLAAAAAHTALALEQRHHVTARAAHAERVEQLARHAGRLLQAEAETDVPAIAVESVSTTLGFEQVAFATVDPAGGRFRIVATAGDCAALPDGIAGCAPDAVEARLRAGRETSGVVVLDLADAAPSGPGQLEGWGPSPWRGGTLAVSLRGPDRALLGVLLAAGPADGCFPSEIELGSLRTFSDQVALALVSVGRLAQVRFDASHDMLTRLGNRRSLSRTLDGADAEDVAVLVVDLDGFKAVNDRLGHAAGDELLRAVADAIRTRLRDRDAAFRIGGDEFAIVLAGAGTDEAMRISRRLERAIAAVTVGGARVRASIGVACSTHHGRDVTQLLQLADARMYERKRRARRPAAA